MSELMYPHLFEPLELGNIVLRNRIEAAPTGFCSCTSQGFALQRAVDFFERKAMGGAAIVTLAGGVFDQKSGLDEMGGAMDFGTSDAIPSLSLIADAILKHGAIPSVQLHHPGMFVPNSIKKGYPAYGPVEIPIGGSHTEDGLKGHLSTAMTEEVIWDYVEQWANCAAIMKAAGFQMVMVHGGHGWQISQFISPQINKRDDKWGGERFENRMRFPQEICKAIKDKCGKDFPIEFRLTGDEINSNGYDIQYGIEIAKALDDYVDLIHVSTGTHEVYEAFVATSPSVYMPEGPNLHYATDIKKQVKTPVVTVGAYNDPAHMEGVLADGFADVIAIARGLIADPYMPKKAFAGKNEEINQCLRCYTCMSSVVNTHYFTCAINPVVGRENENKCKLPDVSPQSVLVCGGGIAGMQAAITAAERGHTVTLCEKNSRLGGVLLCEEKVEFKDKLKRYIDNQIRRIEQSTAIEVRLNCPVDAEFIDGESPDSVVLAIGARPIIPSFIPGYDLDITISAEEAYTAPEKLDKNVAIIGGGLVGCELGIYLEFLEHTVTILEMDDGIGHGGNVVLCQAVDVKLAETSVAVHFNTKVVEITENGVIAQTKNGPKSFSAGSVVYAVGYTAPNEEIAALKAHVAEVYRVGDCVQSSTIGNAVRGAYYAARDIGVFS